MYVRVCFSYMYVHTADIDEKKGASSKLGAAIGLFEDKEEVR